MNGHYRNIEDPRGFADTFNAAMATLGYSVQRVADDLGIPVSSIDALAKAQRDVAPSATVAYIERLCRMAEEKRAEPAKNAGAKRK